MGFKTVKAIVTGSSGFIGNKLRDALLISGCSVIEFDARINPSMDVSDFDAVNSTLEREQPNIVYHLAGITSTFHAANDPGFCYQLNVGGSANILEAAIRNNVPKVVVASTYLNPIETYSRSKWMADWLCSQYPNTTVLKHCNVYGPGDTNIKRIIPAIIIKLLNGEQPTLTQNAVREFVFIDDVVNEYMSCAGGKYSVRRMTGERIELIELFRMIADIIGSKLEPIMSGVESDPAIDDIQLSIPKNRTSIRDGLVKTVEWYAKHYGNGSRIAEV